MPSEKLETIRASTDAYSRGDLDGFLQSWASDAVLDWSNSNGFEAGVYRGEAEIRAFAERFRGAFEEVKVEFINDPVEVKEDLWVAENVAHFRGRDGVEVEARSAWLITFRNGQQTSLTLYQTKADALEAAGIAD